LGGSGISLRELTVVAEALVELARREAKKRLEAVYKLYGHEQGVRLHGTSAHDVLDTYMIVYLKGGNFTPQTSEAGLAKLHKYQNKYKDWKSLEWWLRFLQQKVSGEKDGDLDMQGASLVAARVGEDFAKQINDKECHDLKNALLGMEDTKQDKRPGRIALSTFYTEGLVAKRWAFKEKIDYLRDLGALDESIEGLPSIIVPNYVSSKPQCLQASSIYGVCCRSECEDLMQSLESSIGEPTATPQRVAKLVEELGSDTIEAPRKLGPELLARLDQVASVNAGSVPLHGRLFAQWMHHAYPRECPFPHEAGKTNPMTPDDWMKDRGQESTQFSDEELMCHVTGDCVGGAKASIVVGADGRVAAEDLPWIEKEELLDELIAEAPEAVRPAAEVAAALPQNEATMEAFSGMIRNLLHHDHHRRPGNRAFEDEAILDV
jgi:hypothetical protein